MGHAFKEQNEFVVALSGSFDVVVKDGVSERHYHLIRSYYGLYIQNGLWGHMENFSANSVAMILSSTFYDEDDYIHDFGKCIEYAL